jgi:hypothetical protein
VLSRHRFDGDPKRFEVIPAYIAWRYGRGIRCIADVAGGQGILTRILCKKYQYECDVIDPRGWVLRGVGHRQDAFDQEMAIYYDLIVGLHPDQALHVVAQAAVLRPTIPVPWCNFRSTAKLGRDELLGGIGEYYRSHGVRFERVAFRFRGPKNVGLVSEPPLGGGVRLWLEPDRRSATVRNGKIGG